MSNGSVNLLHLQFTLQDPGEFGTPMNSDTVDRYLHSMLSTIIFFPKYLRTGKVDKHSIIWLENREERKKAKEMIE